MIQSQNLIANLKRGTAALLTGLIALGPSASPAFAADKPARHFTSAAQTTTATPIQYLVVIFDENISFDHYFGTYPNATNPKFENKFTASATTPTVNGLSAGLLTNNPNLNPANTVGTTSLASNPFRIDVVNAATSDQDHNYLNEQEAFDSGLMDLFPLYTGSTGGPGVKTQNAVMGYFDGNTVTAMWNYAQHFALNDNSYGTTFGPSTPGLMNLVSGQTNGVVLTNGGVAPSGPAAGYYVSDGNGGYTEIGDADPLNDVCANPSRVQAQMGGTTIGDLLEAAGITWGGFMGGFNLNIENSNGTSGCGRTTQSHITGVTENDYTPHHAFFQYWAADANPSHTRPASTSEIGSDGPANHQYDVLDFYAAVLNGNQPAVSFLKAPSYQDGHAGYSDPIDEQTWVVDVVNFLQNPNNNPNWDSTAVVIAYDDSDGWYDHQMGPIVNNSQVAGYDALTYNVTAGTPTCGLQAPQLAGISAAGAQGRCGYGPRLPLLVISPWAKSNFVDHTLTDQTSIIHFIEDNWLGGERIGNGSFDGIANGLEQMFNFKTIRPAPQQTLCLSDTTGEVITSATQKQATCGL
jgi:phospholipase C